MRLIAEAKLRWLMNLKAYLLKAIVIIVLLQPTIFYEKMQDKYIPPHLKVLKMVLCKGFSKIQANTIIYLLDNFK